MLRAAGGGTAERQRADRRPRHRAVGRVASSGPAQGERLVEEQREGGFTYYRAAADEGARDHRALWEVLEAQFAASAGDPAVRADEARLKEVLRLRKESFATHGGTERQLVPGRSWAAWSRALGLLLPALDVADLGCGEGYLTIEAARWARRVVAIDRSREVLGRGRAAGAPARRRNIVWKRGELERCRWTMRRSTSRCCRRRCTTPTTRRARCRGRADPAARRARAGARPAPARSSVGARSPRRPRGWASRTTSSRGC